MTGRTPQRPLVWLLACLGLGAGAITAPPAHAAAQTVVQGRKPVKKQGKAKGKAKVSVRRRGHASRVARERPVAWLRGGLPNVQAAAAVVVDLDSGEELYTRHADAERPIASISKLAAALVALDHGLDLDGLTTISKVDAQVARGGAPSRLLEGMTVSNRDLLHAAMLGSDNRAVSAMGRAVGLDAGRYAAEMTKKAASLGLKHTRFREPTGLSTENVSTPRETLVMLRTAMAHPTLGPVLRRFEYDAHPVSRPPIRYISTYKPAVRSNAEVLGGKTGYNDSARYCLVVAARIDGRRLSMAFLGNEGKMTRFGDFARVADWVVARRPKGAAPLPPEAAPGPTVPLPESATTASTASALPATATVAAPASL